MLNDVAPRRIPIFFNVDQLTLDQLKRPSIAKPIGTLQCERFGAPDFNVSYAPIHALYRLQSQLGMSVQDSNTVCAHDSRYPAISVLYTLFRETVPFKRKTIE
jgi:hypothetical protein